MAGNSMDRGRPRNFDREQALDAAMTVFWRDGYLGASLNVLTDAMGINKPSLYAAFGNKAELYVEVLDQYCRQKLFRHLEALENEDLNEGLRRFLYSVADMLTAKESPGGCLVVHSAVECDSGLLPGDVASALTKIVKSELPTILKKRLLKEKRFNDSSDKKEIEAIADYIIAIMTGMAVMSKVGFNRDRFYKVINRSMLNMI